MINAVRERAFTQTIAPWKAFLELAMVGRDVDETLLMEKAPATGGKPARCLIRQGQYITVDAASGAACCNDLREVVAWACSVEVATCEGAVRCPQSAPRLLARFVSMTSAKLRRGHALSAEHEFGAKASRVDGVACAEKTRHMLMLLMMVMGDNDGW